MINFIKNQLMKNPFAILFISSILNFTSYTGFSQNDGDSLFNSSQIHTIKFYFTQVGWYDSLIAYKPLDKLMMGDVEIDGTYIDSVGIQFKGNSSFNAPGIKKPWKIDFNEYVSGRNYDGLKKLNLNNAMKDPSFMREKLFDDFCRSAGIYGPRATYANVYVNNTLWGFYTLIEQVDKTLLTTQIGNDGGNLFKGDANGTLQWYGTSQSSYYGKYELKTNETANDWTDLVHLIDEINNTPSANFYDSLEAVLNTTSWIEGWAANNIFVNLDSYVGSGHNYYIYHNSATDKFDFIVWDANEAFGNFNMGMNISQLEGLSMSYIPNPVTNRPLTDKLLQNTTYKNIYANIVCNYVANYFSNSYLDPKIDSLYPIIKPHVYADPNKPYSNQQFEDNITMNVMGNIPGLKSFIANRHASLVSQLMAYGCNMGTDELHLSNSFQAYPNPNSGVFTIAGDKFPVQIKIYNSLGQTIHEQTLNNILRTVTLNEATSGIYFYRIFSENIPLTSGKIIVE